MARLPASVKKQLSLELLEVGAELCRIRGEYDDQIQALLERHQRIVDRLTGDGGEPSENANGTNTSLRVRVIRCLALAASPQTPAEIAEAIEDDEKRVHFCLRDLRSKTNPRILDKPQLGRWSLNEHGRREAAKLNGAN
jgi:hypothetical protein